MRSFFLKLSASALVSLVLTGLIAAMMWMTELGNMDHAKLVIKITAIITLLSFVAFLLSPRERLGVGPKGTIKRLKSKKKFHPSWKDLFDHH